MGELTSTYELPASWPASLSPEVLSRIDLPTPFLAGDLRLFRDRLDAFRDALPRVRPFYAVKCNSTPEILRTAAASDAGFGSYSQCHRAFHAEFGCAPTTFFRSEIRERMQLTYAG